TMEHSSTLQSQSFPHFSFCNENPFRRSVVDENPEFREIATFLRQYELISLNETTNDDFNLANITDRLLRQEHARVMQR
ncbi:hypothetical protein PENTCL1PPCAC_9006, partial [Pristionchus entomophagus]